MSMSVSYNDRPVSLSRHSHMYYELLYIVKGLADLSINNNRYRISPGNIIFLNQFEEHEITVLSGEYERYFVLIPPDEMKMFKNNSLLLSAFRLRGGQSDIILQTGEYNSRFLSYFSLLHETSKSQGKYTDDRLEAIMMLILTEAYAICPERFTGTDYSSSLPIQEILNYLDEHFTESFSLERIAEQYYVTPGCLSSNFRELVGVSPMQYITGSRLAYARTLLQGTKMKVQDIANQCGYNDVSAFIDLFRKHFGCTPSQYRRQTI